MFSKEVIGLAEPCYEAIKKISKGKWEWKPEVGEWCLINPTIIKEPQLIVKVDPEALNPIQTHQGYGFVYPDPYPKSLHFNRIIPLLHWERIEGILEGMGYYLQVDRYASERYVADIRKIAELEKLAEQGLKAKDFDERYRAMAIRGEGKSRQKAVMLAVIELAKGR